jgi:hypothetical protein
MAAKIEFEKISSTESWQVFDAAAHRLLNISGDEFARLWDEGVYAHAHDITVMQVAMLRPGGR